MVIAILLIAAYFAIPSLVGDDARNSDQVATVNLTSAHNAARKAWGQRQGYDPIATVADMERFAPDLDFTTTAEINGTDPSVIYVGVDGKQEITLCNRSESRRYFCARADETGKLHGDGDYARSWGTTLTQARCFLPSAGAAPMDCDTGKGGTSWSPGGTSASVTSADVTEAPTFASIIVPSSADVKTVQVTWSIAGGPAEAAMCGVDSAPLSDCDELDAHMFTGLTRGSHTFTMRLDGPGGTTTETRTWVRTRGTSSLYRDEVLADNPLAYWRFDETTGTHARAEVGGVDLVYSEATLGAPSLLYGDSSRSFTLTGEGRAYARATPTGATATNVTIEAWVDIPSLPTRGAVVKVGISDEDEGVGNGNGYAVGFGDRFEVATNQVTGLFEGRRWIHNGGAVPSAGVHHLAMSIDGAGTARIYLDGALLGAYSGSVPYAPGAGVHVGGYWAGTNSSAPISRHFTGGIDEVAIYDKVLSASRILAHYRAGRTPTVG